MRALAILWLALGCEPSTTPGPSAPVVETRAQPETPLAPMRRWTFAPDVRIEVRDVPLEATLPEVAGAALVVNAGFYDRHGRPEGYTVAEGALLAPYLERLGGGVLVLDERATLHDGEVFTPPVEPPRFAIQGRPRLVVEGENNIRSDTGRVAARTALALCEERLEVVVVPDPGITLFAFGEALAGRCDEALNLDGGPSTGFRTPTEYHPPRGAIRQALVFRE